MLKYILVLLLAGCQFMIATAQETESQEEALPYHTIPDYPDTYESTQTLARMIDGLGFRFYWATAELKDSSYTYELGNDSRPIGELLDHLQGLSEVILNTVKQVPNIREGDKPTQTHVEKRTAILQNIKIASDLLKVNAEANISEMEVVFQRGEKVSTFDHWHLYNGPLADAIWHCGQIVMLRRAAGDPMPAGVNVFMGTKK